MKFLTLFIMLTLNDITTDFLLPIIINKKHSKGLLIDNLFNKENIISEIKIGIILTTINMIIPISYSLYNNFNVPFSLYFYLYILNLLIFILSIDLSNKCGKAKKIINKISYISMVIYNWILFVYIK